MLKTTLALLLPALLIFRAQAECRYNIDQTLHPYYVQTEPFLLSETLSACKDFIEPGRLGCCNQFNDEATQKNLGIIDSIFGGQGGCDLCAINIKRFWCAYACSSRQDQFMDVGKKYEPFPDPNNPGGTIMGQRVNVRVHADTACAIFNSCKRVPFVASVSAMGTPSGFLNFQGHNAVSQGFQYVSMNFSYNKEDSLAFLDEYNDYALSNMSTCSTKGIQIHNFTITHNCTCNTCEEACDHKEGYIYQESAVLQGFNWALVGWTYLGVIVISVTLTIVRHKLNKHTEF